MASDVTNEWTLSSVKIFTLDWLISRNWFHRSHFRCELRGCWAVMDEPIGWMRSRSYWCGQLRGCDSERNNSDLIVNCYCWGQMLIPIEMSQNWARIPTSDIRHCLSEGWCGLLLTRNWLEWIIWNIIPAEQWKRSLVELKESCAKLMISYHVSETNCAVNPFSPITSFYTKAAVFTNVSY